MLDTHTLIVPEHGLVRLRGLVAISLISAEGDLLDYEEVENLITQVGDQYYGERATGIASPPAQVTGMHLGTGTTAAAKTGAGATDVTYLSGSNIAIDATYPQSSLSGASRRITWRTTWAAGVATNAAITEVSLVNKTIATDAAAVASETISRAVFSAKAKAAADSLVVTWTHDLLGA